VKLACQIILFLLYVFSFFAMLRHDFTGSPAKEPGGFKGAVYSVLAIGISVFLTYKAGAFSEIIGGGK